MERKIETPEQVVAELRAMSAQFICPKDTYFAGIADIVERLRLDLVAAQRLLREAILRGGLVDERWFREAKKAGGEHE